MTDEEIQSKARGFAAVTAGAVINSELLAGAFEQCIREAREAALEEAAKAVCPHCASGIEHGRCDAAGVWELKEAK